MNIRATRTWLNRFAISCLILATVASFDISMVMGRPFATEGGLEAGDMVKDTMLVGNGPVSHAK